MTAQLKMPETLLTGTDHQKTIEAALTAIKALDEAPLPEDLKELALAHNANRAMLKSIEKLIGTLDHRNSAIEWDLFEALVVRGRRILATASRYRYSEGEKELYVAFGRQWRPRYKHNDPDLSPIPFMGDGEYVVRGRGRCRVTETDRFIDGHRLYEIEPKILEGRFWFQEYAMKGELVGKFTSAA